MNFLLEYISECDVAAAIVSESWLKPGLQLEQEILNLRNEENADLFHFSRKISKKGRPAGGGIAIITNRSYCIMKELKITRGKSEIVCTVGKINGCSRKLVIIGIYISPRCRAPQVHDALERVADVIRKVKDLFPDPFIALGGDFNKAKIEEASNEFPDLTIVNSPPTRGDAKLDLMATNFESDIEAVSLYSPLHTEDGKTSDHGVLIVKASLCQSDRFTTRRIQVRPRTKRGEDIFRSLISSNDWDGTFAGLESVDEMVEALKEKTDEWMQAAFPERTLKLKSTDLPWITFEIKKAIKDRKKIFSKTTKRTAEWREAKKETDNMIKESKKNYYKKMKEMALEKRSTSVYYRAVSKLKDKEKSPAFDIRSMFPDLTDKAISEQVAEYFNRITEDFVAIDDGDEARFPGEERITVTAEDVEKRLRECKKPKSMVACDVFPDLIDKYASKWSVPLSIIYNKCFQTCKWPLLWKSETVIVIPKSESPESLNDLRNLSCTPLFSKVMEFFVLERLKEETKLKANQFGGRKGSGCEHYIIKLLTDIHEALDQKDTACNVLAVDFKKAFNTMDHGACLRQLEDHGASQYLISMIRTFLSNRVMRAKIGATLSDQLKIKGGSPQGTLLGNLLFTLTTDRIEDGQSDTIASQSTAEEIAAVSYDDIGRCVSTPMGVERTISGLTDVSEFHCEPIRRCERTLRYDMSGSESEDESTLGNSFWISEAPPPPNWSVRPLTAVKFIDDLTAACPAYLPASYQIFSQSKTQRIIHAKDCQDFYCTVTKNAEQLGLSVNAKKTQLLCVSPAINSVPSSYIELPTGQKITSQKSLKVLGYTLGASPGNTEQVQELKRKYWARAWIIRNLKRAGLPEEDLIKLYKALVRPVLDYMAPIYHPMLTHEQTKEIERL